MAFEPAPARDADELTDLLRVLGPLTDVELDVRADHEGALGGWLQELEEQRRVGSLEQGEAGPFERGAGRGREVKGTPSGRS